MLFLILFICMFVVDMVYMGYLRLFFSSLRCFGCIRLVVDGVGDFFRPHIHSPSVFELFPVFVLVVYPVWLYDH